MNILAFLRENLGVPFCHPILDSNSRKSSLFPPTVTDSHRHDSPLLSLFFSPFFFVCNLFALILVFFRTGNVGDVPFLGVRISRPDRSNTYYRFRPSTRWKRI